MYDQFGRINYLKLVCALLIIKAATNTKIKKLYFEMEVVIKL